MVWLGRQIRDNDGGHWPVQYISHFSSSFPLTVLRSSGGTSSLHFRLELGFLTRVKKGSEKIAPDAMYGNLYVSGRVGSDATTNPLPAITSTVTTRTHNQPQPHLPFSTVATAALQNNRDDPHLAGNEACLCSLCHIKDRFFPRSQDGKIVLPDPTTTSVHLQSTRLRRHTASMASATPPATSTLPTHRRNRTNSTASNHDREWGAGFFGIFCLIYGWTWVRLSVAKFNEGRRGAGLRTPQLQSDKAEGSFTEPDRISGMCINRCWYALNERWPCYSYGKYWRISSRQHKSRDRYSKLSLSTCCLSLIKHLLFRRAPPHTADGRIRRSSIFR